MKKLKALTIILFFLLLLSTIFSIGIFFITPNYFAITLGCTYIASVLFTFISFVLFVIGNDE